MAWKKKYDHLKPYKRVRCIDAGDCKYLNYGIRGVIKENDTNYLIQFTNGSAKWYSKDRFVERQDTELVIKDRNTFTDDDNLNEILNIL